MVFCSQCISHSVPIFRHKCTIKSKTRKMEKWSFDGIEGQVKRYAVNEEIIVIEDEFVNPNSCGKCRTLEERIRILEAELENEKKEP